jgi:primosomal protein N' (replication factor Y)
MERKTYFVDVILPVPIPKMYTYRVPFELNDQMVVGQRVVVQFGRNKLYTALVRKIHENVPSYTAKYLESVLDETPIIVEQQFKLWEWMSSYYMCCIGEVMAAALPGSLKLASESNIVLNPDFQRNYEDLSDKEYLITEALEIRNILSLKEVSEILEQKTVHHIIKSLIEKRVVLIEEELKEQYKPKKQSFVRLTPEVENEDRLKEAFDQLSKAPKQLEVLMIYLQMCKRYEEEPTEVKRTQLQKAAGATASVVNQLAKKGIFEIYEKEIGRLGRYEGDVSSAKELSEHQQEALKGIEEQFEEKDVVLLHGVTSSGKTEVYVDLIEKALEKGKQVLYLLPEIALTTQIINRLRLYFGDRIGVYHSKFNQNERVEVWNKVLQHKKGDFDIILGARSALFLPFSNLGLIIIDEEHENTYKQYDPAPRYHARDSAMILARLHGAKTLLGSATPSIESAWNAHEGRYGKVMLTKRFGGVQLPEIQCADVKEETRKKLMKSIFSSFLLNEMKAALEKGEQIILFQNRRGYAPMWNCEVCGWAPQCIRCDISLTYHKHAHTLKCHYCGYNIQPPKRCDACGSGKLKMIGFGTEKIEEELAIFLPDVRIARMDLDTTRSKNSYQRIINDFEDKAIDVLVGTQMVTKGLDFDNVALVGILNADSMLAFPDFRAFERSYQLMAQVSGRAGRKKKRGKVIIQTYAPNHWIIQKVMSNDYEGMYAQEIIERKNFHYPPFFRLIRLTIRHKDPDLVDYASDKLAEMLRNVLGRRVLGPEFPLVSRIKNYYNKNILIKIERQAAVSKAKEVIEKQLLDFQSEKEFKPVRVIIDVDPM